jgi:hypothetical protein
VITLAADCDRKTRSGKDSVTKPKIEISVKGSGEDTRKTRD